MKQYEVLIMVPTISVVTASTIEDADKRAESIRDSFDPVRTTMLGGEAVHAYLLGLKEAKNDKPKGTPPERPFSDRPGSTQFAHTYGEFDPFDPDPRAA
jgi:hypothetical protein